MQLASLDVSRGNVFVRIDRHGSTMTHRIARIDRRVPVTGGELEDLVTRLASGVKLGCGMACAGTCYAGVGSGSWAGCLWVLRIARERAMRNDKGTGALH
jgi:hypothetical protein